MPTPQITICSRDQIYRTGLATLLGSKAGQVRSVGEGNHLLRLVQQRRVDVVLIDLGAPVEKLAAWITTLAGRFPNLPMMALSDSPEDSLERHFLEPLVKEFLPRQAEPEQVQEAIKRAVEQQPKMQVRWSRGEQTFPKAKTLSRADNSAIPMDGFSARELEVLQLICLDYTNEEIANQLAVSSRTIEGYKLKIKEKIGTRSVTAAIAFAVANGLVNMSGLEKVG